MEEVCPRCKGSLVKRGMGTNRKVKQRYLCKKCNLLLTKGITLEDYKIVHEAVAKVLSAKFTIKEKSKL